MLRLKGDWVGHLQGALTNDTASDRHTLLSWVVTDAVWAFVGVATTVVLVSAVRILVALLAEIGVSTASEGGKVAAVVALVLDVAETVLLAHELIADLHVLKTTALTHELLLFHAFLLCQHFLDEEFILAVNIATEERTMTAGALIELRHVKSILKWLLIEAI